MTTLAIFEGGSSRLENYRPTFQQFRPDSFCPFEGPFVKNPGEIFYRTALESSILGGGLSVFQNFSSALKRKLRICLFSKILIQFLTSRTVKNWTKPSSASISCNAGFMCGIKKLFVLFRELLKMWSNRTILLSHTSSASAILEIRNIFTIRLTHNLLVECLSFLEYLV